MNNTFSKLTFIALLTSLLLITGCKKSQPSSATQTAQDPNLVMANESLLAQIKISEVSQSDVSDILRVAGQIDFDEQALTRIGASVTGRVTQINAQLGNEVKKGDTLALINSSELSNSQLAYLKARSEKEFHRRTVQRAKTLFEADVISAAELQRRESEYEVASAQTRAAQDQLRVLGVNLKAMEELATTGSIDSVASVMATIKGVVVERKVTTGQVVQPADVLFTVADLSRVWAVAQVPEQQVAQVKVGQSVRIEVPALQNEQLLGKLIYVGQTVNPETRTVLVRTELDNTSGRLKPSMLASMLIESTPKKQLVIPTSAVVREQDADYVFVQEKPGVFRLKPVRLTSEHNGQRVVLDGLSQGVKIVSDGAFHLNNHRNLKDMEKGE
ncbi:MAG: efflux RND transporter periplasmic adaptor subunit [Limnohabitans sp.]|jgi:cobalt-zinc-cadmium efflux system membrane fusion protein